MDIYEGQPCAAPIEWPKVAAQMRQIRREQGIRQDAVAEALGIDRTYLHRLEHGTRTAPAPLFLRWMGAIGARWDELALPEASRVPPRRAVRWRIHEYASRLRERSSVSSSEAERIAESRVRSSLRRRLERSA